MKQKKSHLELGREILARESEALLLLAETLDTGFTRAAEMVSQCQGTVLVAGLGKSGLVARKWVATLNGTGTPAAFLNPAEALHGDLGVIRPQDLLFCLSFRGETEELGIVAKFAQQLGCEVIAVTGRPESSLASVSSFTVAMPALEEACPLKLAPTSSTAAMMALGDAIACCAFEARGFTERDFARLHPGGSLGRRLWLSVADLMHRGAELPIVPPDAKLAGVLVQMTQKRLGLAVVMDKEQVCGIITDGDLRRYLQRTDFSAEITAAEMMTKTPKQIGRGALATEARAVMESNQISHLLVFDEEKRFVGVVHLQDLLKARVL